MKRFVLSVMLMLGLVATPSLTVAAQPTESDAIFQSALSGDTVDLGTSGEITFLPENYDLSEGRTVAEEFIWFTYDWSNFEVVIVEGDIATDEYYDLTMGNMMEFYDVFEVIDENVGADHAFFLANATYQGSEMVVLYDYQLDALGDFDLLVMQFAPADALVMDMEFVQQEVTVGDQPLLANTDPQEVEALLGGGSTGTSQGESTPESRSGTSTGITERMGRLGDSGTGDTATAEATETTGTTRTSRTTRTAGTTATEEATATEATGTSRTSRTTRSTGTTATEEATATETSSTSTGTTRATRATGSTQATATEGATEAAGGDWASMGLVSDTEWVSPNFQTSVTWDGAMWEFPTEYEYAIFLNEDPVYDSITLETVDGLGYAFVTVRDPGERTPDTLADYYTSPEYADSFEAGVTIIEVSTTENTVAVVYETVNARNQPLMTVLTATFMDDGTVIFTQISGSPERIQDVYAQFEDGIMVNGVPLVLNYTAEEIAVLAGN